MRSLLQEYRLTPDDFITPLFIIEGKQLKEPIPSMPGYFRMSLDLIAEKVITLWKQDLKAVLLFVKVPEGLKDNEREMFVSRSQSLIEELSAHVH